MNVKKTLLALLLALCLASASAGVSAETTGRYTAQFLDVFDTYISLIAYAPSQAAFDSYAKIAHETFWFYHRLFDAYNAYGGTENIFSLNSKAMNAPVAVDAALFDLLQFCKSNQPLTQGTVNIAMGGVLSLWHDAREAAGLNPDAAALPDLSALQSAAQHTAIDDLILDEAAMTVFYADPLLRLDVGAIAKGYATEKVAQALAAEGLESFILNAGGNVRAYGKPDDPTRETWNIGIENPVADSDQSLVETFYANDISVVTSGDYQRFYTVSGVRYHHLIDPVTLMPGTYYHSATVLTQDSGMADLLSTAVFLLPYEQSLALVESLDGVEAMWVMPDGEVRMTEGASTLAKSSR